MPYAQERCPTFQFENANLDPSLPSGPPDADCPVPGDTSQQHCDDQSEGLLVDDPNTPAPGRTTRVPGKTTTVSVPTNPDMSVPIPGLVENASLPEQASLRRSTRIHRAPDRLDLSWKGKSYENHAAVQLSIMCSLDSLSPILMVSFLHRLVGGRASMVVAGTSLDSKVCRCTVESQHPGPQLMAAMLDGGQAKVMATLFTSIMYI